MFVEHANKAGQPDRDMIIFAQRSKEVAEAEELRQLCQEFDEDKSGAISYSEFSRMIDDDRISVYLAAIGLDIPDAQVFFAVLLDISQNKKVDIEMFVQGCMRMKGAATSVDMQALSYQLRMACRNQMEFQRRCLAMLARLGLQEGIHASSSMPFVSDTPSLWSPRSTEPASPVPKSPSGFLLSLASASAHIPEHKVKAGPPVTRSWPPGESDSSGNGRRIRFSDAEIYSSNAEDLLGGDTSTPPQSQGFADDADFEPKPQDEGVVDDADSEPKPRSHRVADSADSEPKSPSQGIADNADIEAKACGDLFQQVPHGEEGVSSTPESQDFWETEDADHRDRGLAMSRGLGSSGEDRLVPVYRKGERVEALFIPLGKWYTAYVIDVSPDGTCSIEWLDGDRRDISKAPAELRKCTQLPQPQLTVQEQTQFVGRPSEDPGAEGEFSI